MKKLQAPSVILKGQLAIPAAQLLRNLIEPLSPRIILAFTKMQNKEKQGETKNLAISRVFILSAGAMIGFSPPGMIH